MGLNDVNVVERLLVVENLSLQKATKICRAEEAAKRYRIEMRDDAKQPNASAILKHKKNEKQFRGKKIMIHRNRQRVPHFHVAGVQNIIIKKINALLVKVFALCARERYTGLKNAKNAKIENPHLRYQYQWEVRSLMVLRQLSLQTLELNVLHVA